MIGFLTLQTFLFTIPIVTCSTVLAIPLFNNVVILSFLLVCLLYLITVYRKKYIFLYQKNNLIRNEIKSLQQEVDKIKGQNKTLFDSQEQLKEVNTTKDKFFSIISHDLRGPLNSITGLLQILIGYADSFSKAELQDFAKSMDKSVRNLLDLLGNLLRWSQTQTGNIEYRPQVIELHKVAYETANLLEMAAANKKIDVSINIDKELKAYADSDMLSFVLRNLIHNAIKFTYAGGQVQIYSKIIENQIEVAVSDSGIGMSKQEINKLFKIDTCYTTSGTAKEIGTGLGLILCNEFIEKNGGLISVESELKKGTTFRFTLPLVTLTNPELIAISDN